jgi:hypothetical protein
LECFTEEQEHSMENDEIAVGQLLVAHELEIRELKIEMDTLRSELKCLRADLLATLKHSPVFRPSRHE